MHAVVAQGMTPEDACTEIGVPYMLMVAYKDEDPKIAAVWEYQKERQEKQRRIASAVPASVRESFELQAFWQRGLMKAGLFDHIFQYVAELEGLHKTDNEKWEKRVENLLRNKLPQTVLPKAAQPPSINDTAEDLPDEVLHTELQRRNATIAKLYEEKESAAQQRRVAAGLEDDGTGQ